MQALVEQREVLLLLLLGSLSRRVVMGYDPWARMLRLWAALELGELPPEKRYLVMREPEAPRMVRAVGALMVLVAIQAMQLGELMPGGDPSAHPFVAELRAASKYPHEPLDLLREGRVQRSTEPLAVVGLLWVCFIYLSKPALYEQLPPAIQGYWRRAPDLLAEVQRHTPDRHFAMLVRTLLVEPELGALAEREPNLSTMWGLVGFQTMLRQAAERFRPASTRPEINAMKLPLAEALDALIMARFSGFPLAQQQQQQHFDPPLMAHALTETRLEYLVLLTAAIYHGSELLSMVFWDTVDPQTGMRGHPLNFLLASCMEHPLLLFQLVTATACDPESAVKAAEFLHRPFVSAYDDNFIHTIHNPVSATCLIFR
jgi:hypothetical protein